MKLNAAFWSTEVFIAWFIVAAAAVTCYALVLTPEVREMRTRSLTAKAYYELAARNRRFLSRANELAASRVRLRADIAKLGAGSDARATAWLLQMLEREAGQYNVVFAGMEPDDRSGLDGVGINYLKLSFRGLYPGMVELIAALSSGNVLLKTLSVEMSDASTESAVEVDATVRAALYDSADAFTDQSVVEKKHVSIAP